MSELLSQLQHPVAWIRIRGDRVIVSRCDWMYPASTEDAAGPRDEQRFMAVGRRDGDIVLPAPEGALDREDLKTMLTWPNTSKPAEQKPAPDVDQLVGALAIALEALEDVMGNINPERGFVEELEEELSTAADTVRAAIAAHRKGGDA